MTVVIIGGGIVGLSCAYYLATRGSDVTVLEKSSIGGGSTGRANGGIRTQFTSPVSVKLSKESLAVWETFEAEFGVDIRHRRPGYLFLARTNETTEQFHENVEQQNELGVNSSFLSPTEAKKRCPKLNADNYVAATYNSSDGFADPHLAVQGFSTAATVAGAEIRTNVAVTDILIDDGCVCGVETAEGTVEAECVVNAAGPWAARVGAMAGLDLPVAPKRRQLMVVNPDNAVPETAPMTVDMDGGAHFRPEREGKAVVGGYFDDADPDQNPDAYRKSYDFDWTLETLEQAAEMAEYFGPESEVVQGWAGLYAVTPDHHPIIEETRPGFVNAVGFSGHGFMQSPATGKVVSELVLDGEPKTVDVSALSAVRFAHGRQLTEGTVID